MFLVLGLLVTPSDLLPIAPQALALASVLIFIARPGAVFLSLLPFRFPWREQLFVGWVGLRGAVPIVLALFPLLAGLEQAEAIFNITFFVVLVSLVVQGWTVAPAARWLGLELPPRSAMRQRVDLDIPGELEYELVGYRLEAGSPAAGRAQASLALPTESRLVAVIRNERLLRPEASGEALAQGDHIYLLAARQELQSLDRLFVAEQAPERLAPRRVFGEFVLNADARLSDLTGVYGFSVPDEIRHLTVGGYLQQSFHNRAVVGDRVQLGPVDFVVREIEGDTITRVGLRLSH
jgi:cell volume regulation protein A